MATTSYGRSIETTAAGDTWSGNGNDAYWISHAIWHGADIAAGSVCDILDGGGNRLGRVTAVNAGEPLYIPIDALVSPDPSSGVVFETDVLTSDQGTVDVYLQKASRGR